MRKKQTTQTGKHHEALVQGKEPEEIKLTKTEEEELKERRTDCYYHKTEQPSRHFDGADELILKELGIKRTVFDEIFSTTTSYDIDEIKTNPPKKILQVIRNNAPFFRKNRPAHYKKWLDRLKKYCEEHFQHAQMYLEIAQAGK